MTKRAIVWFKTDLRIHDNETLMRAIELNDEIIPVYCFEETQLLKTEFGTAKQGNFRVNFLLESLVDLDKNLRALGSGLIVTIGKPEVQLIEIAKKYGVQSVFSKKEVGIEEKQTQMLVEQELWKMKCTLDVFSTSTLYHAQDLPFALKDIPDVFTNYRKRIERDSKIRPVIESPLVIKSPTFELLKLPTLSILGFNEVQSDERRAFHFKGGETEGKKRLHEYLFETKSIATYKETRNGMLGENYSSKFSAWLSLGCLSPREIYDQIKRYESTYTANESTYWLIFELLWRDYFRFMMKKHGHYYFLQQGIAPIRAELNKHNSTEFEKWKNADTGNDFIDANMMELNLTGFMSNRGRQNVASFLCHELKLDWRYGAAYFEEKLIDYDVCSNWGNWAYLAGVGNDPRAGRVFNSEKQAKEYDPKNKYRELWLNKI